MIASGLQRVLMFWLGCFTHHCQRFLQDQGTWILNKNAYGTPCPSLMRPLYPGSWILTVAPIGFSPGICGDISCGSTEFKFPSPNTPLQCPTQTLNPNSCLDVWIPCKSCSGPTQPSAAHPNKMPAIILKSANNPGGMGPRLSQFENHETLNAEHCWALYNF